MKTQGSKTNNVGRPKKLQKDKVCTVGIGLLPDTLTQVDELSNTYLNGNRSEMVRKLIELGIDYFLKTNSTI